jgi:hypothetical protein
MKPQNFQLSLIMVVVQNYVYLKPWPKKSEHEVMHFWTFLYVVFYKLFCLNVPLILKWEVLVDCTGNCVREFIFIVTNDVH